MTVETPQRASRFAVPPGPVRRFTVDEYHQMISTGILGAGDRVELQEGWIVPKMPHNPPHDGTIQLCDEVLRGLVPKGWCVRIQSAITLSDSEPEPDIVVVAGAGRTYVNHHPGPSEIAVAIEVADSSLAQDRGPKQRMYARAGIPQYWIVNLVDRQVETYSDPTNVDAVPAYGARRDYRSADRVPVVVAGQDVGAFRVDAVLP